MTWGLRLLSSLLATLVCTPALADLGLSWVTVADPGNPPDDEVVTCCDDRVLSPPDYEAGSVAYSYRVMRYELTNVQWVEFLNAVAAADPNGLYNPYDFPQKGYARSGVSGSYVYTVRPDFENLPAVGLNWYRAARLANWLHNGQPTGPQGPATTEDGAYDLSLGDFTPRRPGARFWIPNEDETHKAAFWDPVEQRYWDYGIRGTYGIRGIVGPSNLPAADLPGAPAPAANYCPPPDLRFPTLPAYDCDPIPANDWPGVPGPGGLGFLSEIGAYPGSESPWSLFDVVGNAAEGCEDRFVHKQNGSTQYLTRGYNHYAIGPGDNSSAGRNYAPVATDGGGGIGVRLASSVPSRCGLGWELALLLPPLMWLRQHRRRGSARM